MATLALTIVGNLIAPGVGGIVGGLIGAPLDHFLVFPSLFPRDTVTGPRLDNARIIRGSEGQPINWVIGQRVRVAGHVIWATDIRPVKRKRRVGGSGPAAQKVEEFEHYISAAVAWAEVDKLGPLSRVVRILAQGQTIWQEGMEGGPFESITNYDGSQTTPDPVMEAEDGIGEVPAYLKMCFTVLESLQIDEWGSLPNLEAILEQTADMSVAEAIAAVLTRYDFDVETEYDGSSLPYCFAGMVSPGPQQGVQNIVPVVETYAVTLQEVGDTVVARPTGFETPIKIDPGDLGAISFGSTPTEAIEVQGPRALDLPREVRVRYFDLDYKLESGSQTYVRWDHPSRHEMGLDVPLTLSGSDALAIAKREAWTAEAEKHPITFTLPPSYLYLREGSAVEFALRDIEYAVLVRKVTVGADYRVEIQGVIYHADVYTQSAEVDEYDHPDTPYNAPDVIQVFGDVPALTDEEVDRVGFYYAAATADPAASWRGARLLRSEDGTAFEDVGPAASESIIGTVVVPPGPGSTAIIDETNSIVVKLVHGGLASCTEEECMAGRNRCAIRTPSGEWEILGFIDAELLGTRTYRLSRLLRGLRGTEHLVGSHAGVGERFVAPDGAGFEFHDLGLPSLGTDDFYKIVPSRGVIDEYEAERVPITGRTMKPLSPVLVKAQWDEATGDVTITWFRRTKYIIKPFQPAPLAPDEVPETYEVEFVWGRAGHVLRTVTVTDRQYTYTFADQLADAAALSLGTPSKNVTPIHVRIYQISHAVGRGTPADHIFRLSTPLGDSGGSGGA